jgi:hypothetical protein
MKTEIQADIYKKQAKQVIKTLKKRNICALYFASSREAIEAIRGMIPKKSLVAFGGSVTIVESGLVDALREMDVDLLDRYKKDIPREKIDEMRKRGMDADVLIASCNAVTADGKLVNQDGLGNRVAGIIFGPKKVILMVGMNKIVRNVEEGMARIKSVCAPMNSIRFGAETPCSRTGFCDDENCHPPARICNQLTIVEGSAVAGRITVVLVGEPLGF